MSKRYSITKSREATGGEFVNAAGKPSPLVWEFDELSDAMRHLQSAGGRGEIVDHQTQGAFSVRLGDWYDCSEYLDAIEGPAV